ncbi:hypothetical protein [Moorena sp. SIO3H5]|uniref:hypothetical protein n=1 Tax=Moorena sp. SIO3H5 TaxID=2607834 RepID=UPI0013BD08ED|nr:hypothetical protein [Moorena sp. SIO3H5]NEO72142.1 class I SAM-dependent methyltransferase [Moorena sp. SIO3H5]
MSRRTKKEIWVDDRFTFEEGQGEFIFTNKEDNSKHIMEGFEVVKNAKIALYDSMMEQEKDQANAKKQAQERSVEMNLKELEAVFNKYPSDKKEHGYLPFYAIHLPSREKKFKLLEIGCDKGYSVRAWREYFPNAEITILDLHNAVPEDLMQGKNPVEYIQGDQGNEDLIEYLAAKDFDVVIDDGSHNARHQWLTIEKFTRPGALVVIEDLHCNTEKFFTHPPMEFDKTPLGQIKSGKFPHAVDLYLEKIAFIQK